MIRYDHYTDKFVKVSDRECPWCKAVCASTDKYCHECGWHIADTPQTDCDKCIWNVCNYNKVEWDADTPQTEEPTAKEYEKWLFKEPQTDCYMCKWMGDRDVCGRCRNRNLFAVADTPQTDWHYDEQDATWYPYKHEDEPQQKSCATCKHALGNWDGESNNCERCCGADRRFYKPKTESQTERSK